MSTEEEDKKLTSGDDQDDDDDDEEDVEQLQAEIARMEAEANRIAKETEELENKKGGAAATKATGGAPASSSGETPNRDGCVRIKGCGWMNASMVRAHLSTILFLSLISFV